MDTKVTTKLTKEDFNEIITKMDNLITSIEVITCIVMNKELLLKRGTNFIKASTKSLSKLSSNADMAMTDYYHILAMTDINENDLLKLSLKFRDLLNARNKAKQCNLILNQFKILLTAIDSNKATYKTKVLCEKDLSVQF